jgi:ATP-dependent helicase/DNAse subunit B
VLTAFADALENTVAVPLGGQGGGVRVLDVMHARGLTFGRLFVVGLNRGAFPRRIAGDPLLPDAVRAALREALPLLPLKGEGLDEEHYLFAQLCASAEYVTLSWQYSDAEGRELSRSSLIERLLLHRGEDAVDRVASRRQERLRADLDADRVLTLSDHLQLAALSSGRRDLPKRLAAAFDGKAAAQHARARLDVLNEYDDTFAAGPSAYMGLVGAPVKNDPREAQLYVTTLESFARCPWKCFLEKVLRLEPSADPLRALPNPGSCVGDAVHKTLQRLVQAQAGAMGGSLSDALTREPVRVAPPAEASVRDVVHEVAARLATEEGIHLPLLHEALDRLVYERVQLVLDDWRGKAPEVIGVEVQGHVDVAVGDATVRIGFKADRVDRADGTVRLLDYKTGRKPRTSLAKALQTGLQLQLALYIRSIADDPADGAYVYLDTDGGCTTEVRFRKDSDMDVLDEVLEPLLRGWREGVFFPRVQEPPRDTEPGTCRYCDFAQACCRGDSGFRRRLAALAESGSEPLLGALWSLGRVADETSGVKA